MTADKEESHALILSRANRLASTIESYYRKSGREVTVEVKPDGSLSSNVATLMGRPDGLE